MIYRIKELIKEFFMGIKWFIQRGKRGYSDRDMWCFWDYLCEIIPPVMRWYIKNGHGCPPKFYDDLALDDEYWKWNLILENIADGFESIRKLDNLDSPTKYVVKNLTKRFEKGMKLLTKVFRNLWD